MLEAPIGLTLDDDTAFAVAAVGIAWAIIAWAMLGRLLFGRRRDTASRNRKNWPSDRQRWEDE